MNVLPSSYEDLMFGEDEEEDRPGMKAKKKVTIPCFFFLISPVIFLKLLFGITTFNE